MTYCFPFLYLKLRMRGSLRECTFNFLVKKYTKMYFKINRSVKTPWHSPSMGVALSGLWAPENSQHFAMPPLIFQRNDVWRTNAEVPCWWHVTSKFSTNSQRKQWWRRDMSSVYSRQTCLLGGWVNKPFPCPLEPLYQNEVIISAQPLIWKGFFHSHANKTLFHNKSCALGLILKVRGFGTRKRPNSFCLKLNTYNDILLEQNLDCS